jgi:hypothetical protein
MNKHEFLSTIDKLDRDDYIEADIIPFKFSDGMLKVSSKDEGNFFLVYLVKDYGRGIECIDTVTSHKEANHLVNKLIKWIIGEDFDDDGWN